MNTDSCCYDSHPCLGTLFFFGFFSSRLFTSFFFLFLITCSLLSFSFWNKSMRTLNSNKQMTTDHSGQRSIRSEEHMRCCVCMCVLESVRAAVCPSEISLDVMNSYIYTTSYWKQWKSSSSWEDIHTPRQHWWDPAVSYCVIMGKTKFY